MFLNNRTYAAALLLVFTGTFIEAQELRTTGGEPIFDIGDIEVPEGGAADVGDFLQELTQLQQQVAKDYRAAMAKISAAQTTAAGQILSDSDVSDDLFTIAARIGLAARVRAVANQSPDEKRDVLDMVKRQLEIGVQKGIQRTEVSNASALVSYLERGGDTELARDACESFIELLSDSEDNNARAQLSRFKGVARRLNLLGNPIKLTGELLDGSEFDWTEYEGKVVLVDFWATWCGPCLAEAPNVLKNYDKYHDRGFEVVAISLDSDKGALEKYVESKNVPWANLFQQGAGWKHPMAVKYGVSAIPTVFLINREGNVVSLRARGAELGKQLKALLETEEDLKREIAECSRKLEDSPENVDLLLRRAEAFAGLEDWDLASDDWRLAVDQDPKLAERATNRFKEAGKWKHSADFAMSSVELKPDDVQSWLKVAPVYALCGDPDRYADFCRRMVQHFKDSDDWRHARITSKSCLLLPDMIDLKQLPLARVADGFDGKHTEYTLAWSWSLRALIAYRNGQPEDALKYLEESEKHKPVFYARALNAPLVALANHELGNEAEAKEALQLAVRYQNQLTASDTSKHHHDTLIAGLILDQAREAIAGKED